MGSSAIASVSVEREPVPPIATSELGPAVGKVASCYGEQSKNIKWINTFALVRVILPVNANDK